MNMYTLAVCDSQEKYLRKLQEMLKMRGTFPFEIQIYSDFRNYMKRETSEGDILLIASGEYEKLKREEEFGDFEKHHKELRIILDDGHIPREEGINYIYRYQSVDEIRKEILRLYGQKRGELQSNSNSEKKTKIIGVYSPIGRCLQTSFSLLLGQFLAKKKKTLYLNFEPYSGLSNMLGKSEERNLVDLIYSTHGKQDRVIYQLESMVSNMNGLDFIAPASSFLDLSSITEDNWIILLETLKSAGNYDYIILDLSEMVQGLLNVLRECAMVYTITRADGFAIAKMAQYEGLLLQMDYQDVLSKTKKCEFPIFKKIPYEIEMLPYSDLAGYVKKMIAEEPELAG